MPIAVITGGNKGLGLSQSRRFLQAGFEVHVVARSRADFGTLGQGAHFHECDIAADRAADWLAAIHACAGPIAALVNNAGVVSMLKLEDIDVNEGARVMDINAKGVFLGTKAAIPEMRKAGGGSIVNISSTAGLVGSLDGSPSYTATKGAVRLFTKATAIQYAKENIRCNSVHPGPIDTEIWGKDDSPSGYTGTKHPPAIVVDAIMECIEKKVRAVIAPRYSPQLLAARFMRTFAPGLMLKGMQMMEPVPAEVVESARADALRRRDDN